MSIFSKQIESITYEDVIRFCEQGISEGISLDYKENFSSTDNSKLAKTICSFANAYGGTIVIGVKDKDSKPLAPFEGIEYSDKLEEKVWSIVLSNIYPPLNPLIRICPPVQSKTFIIIRVEQSNRTPHAIHNNTQIYIRTGNVTQLEDLASVDKIEWLFNERRKSEEFRLLPPKELPQTITGVEITFDRSFKERVSEPKDEYLKQKYLTL